jgi:hypothetical protein
VHLEVLSRASRDAVESALRGQSGQLSDTAPRLVVFDGRARHVLDPTNGLSGVCDELLALTPSHALSACAALAALAELIVAADPEVQPGAFIERLGEQVAGVRPGVRGLADLATGGWDHLRGDGFRDELDDGTPGQARHFAGVAAAAARFGGDLTQVAGRHLLGDGSDTADANLTEKALEFVGLLESGELVPRSAANWVRQELCGPHAP